MTDDRRTGYATENVTPITALEQASIDDLWAELRVRLPDHEHPYEAGPDNVCIHCGKVGSYAHMHEHGPYGWRGCPTCRQLEAERVSALFPDPGMKVIHHDSGSSHTEGVAATGCRECP